MAVRVIVCSLVQLSVALIEKICPEQIFLYVAVKIKTHWSSVLQGLMGSHWGLYIVRNVAFLETTEIV